MAVNPEASSSANLLQKQGEVPQVQAVTTTGSSTPTVPLVNPQTAAVVAITPQQGGTITAAAGGGPVPVVGGATSVMTMHSYAQPGTADQSKMIEASPIASFSHHQLHTPTVPPPPPVVRHTAQTVLQPMHQTANSSVPNTLTAPHLIDPDYPIPLDPFASYDTLPNELKNILDNCGIRDVHSPVPFSGLVQLYKQYAEARAGRRREEARVASLTEDLEHVEKRSKKRSLKLKSDLADVKLALKSERAEKDEIHTDLSRKLKKAQSKLKRYQGEEDDYREQISKSRRSKSPRSKLKSSSSSSSSAIAVDLTYQKGGGGGGPSSSSKRKRKSSSSQMKDDVKSWDEYKVCEWLEGFSFGSNYADNFVKCAVDGWLLFDLDDETLEKELKVKKLHRIRLLREIQDLKAACGANMNDSPKKAKTESSFVKRNVSTEEEGEGDESSDGSSWSEEEKYGTRKETKKSETRRSSRLQQSASPLGVDKTAATTATSSSISNQSSSSRPDGVNNSQSSEDDESEYDSQNDYPPAEPLPPTNKRRKTEVSSGGGPQQSIKVMGEIDDSGNIEKNGSIPTQPLQLELGTSSSSSRHHLQNGVAHKTTRQKRKVPPKRKAKKKSQSLAKRNSQPKRKSKSKKVGEEKSHKSIKNHSVPNGDVPDAPKRLSKKHKAETRDVSTTINASLRKRFPCAECKKPIAPSSESNLCSSCQKTLANIQSLSRYSSPSSNKTSKSPRKTPTKNKSKTVAKSSAKNVAKNKAKQSTKAKKMKLKEKSPQKTRSSSRIAVMTSPVNVKVDFEPGTRARRSKKHGTGKSSKKHAKTSAKRSSSSSQTQSSTSSNLDSSKRAVPVDGQTYEVEKILATKVEADGERLFFVKWKGYPSSENTWEPAENFGDSNLPEAFLESEGVSK